MQTAAIFQVENTVALSEKLWGNLWRPAILLTRSPTCALLSVYLAFMYVKLYIQPIFISDDETIRYGTYYLLFATFPGRLFRTELDKKIADKFSSEQRLVC